MPERIQRWLEDYAAALEQIGCCVEPLVRALYPVFVVAAIGLWIVLIVLVCTA